MKYFINIPKKYFKFHNTTYRFTYKFPTYNCFTSIQIV